MDNHQPANDQELDEGAPVIAILGTPSGTVVGPAACRAGADAWSYCRQKMLGLSVSTLNQPCEVPELRLKLHDEVEHHGRAQMILRIGYGGKPSYTVRRPLSAVLEFEGRRAASAAEKVVCERLKTVQRPVWKIP